jgi:multidrug efflux system membrane fusion protein
MGSKEKRCQGYSSIWRGEGKLCLIILLTFFAASCAKREEPKATEEVVRPVKIMEVGATTADPVKRRFPGTVRASRRVDLAFQVDGPLIELPVEEGQRVNKGDLVARVDPRDLEVALRNEQARLETARATLKSMRQARPEDIRRLSANVEKAEAILRLTTKEYDRWMRIQAADPGAVSQRMIDRAFESKERADADLAKAREELQIGQVGARPEDIEAKEAEIRSLEAAVDGAKLQLSYTYLRAPFSGMISKRHVDNFQEVRRKEAIVSLDDVMRVEILVDLPERDMALARGGGTAKVYGEFEAAPGKRYPLRIKEFAARADPVTQTYKVTLEMEQPKEITILPGMTGNVVAAEKLVGSSRVVIPAIAVFADKAGASHVWVIEPESMAVQARKVTTGDLTGTDSITIREGLKPGEKIAVSGVSQLQEGMKVRPFAQGEWQ